MISPWIVYLISVMDTLRFVGGVFFVLTAMLLFFIAIIYIFSEKENEEEEEKKTSSREESFHFRKIIYITLAILLLGAGVSSFVPSKEEMAGILATKIASKQHLSIKDTVVLKERILRIINGCEGEDE